MKRFFCIKKLNLGLGYNNSVSNIVNFKGLTLEKSMTVLEIIDGLEVDDNYGHFKREWSAHLLV